MWQEYHRALQDKNVSERLLDTLDGITTALRFNVMDMVKGWQEMNRKNPLVFLDHDFRKYPVSLYFGCDKETSEYAVTDKSALSIAVYYLKRVYESGRYIQACPICGRSFVAKTAGMTTLCSDECRRIQGKENKRRFDERAKRTSYERSSKNAYMYWYNKIARLRDMPEIPNHLLKKAESLFKAYTEESAKQKKAVAKKQTNPEVFEAWLLSQRDVIDKIMEKILSSVKR
jgi:predicted nucleic acid-binding Zn ribbon protein